MPARSRRDLRGGEQIEGPPRDWRNSNERGEQEQEIAQHRDQRVEQAIDDVDVEAAADKELQPEIGRVDGAGDPDERQPSLASAGQSWDGISDNHGDDQHRA